MRKLTIHALLILFLYSTPSTAQNSMNGPAVAPRNMSAYQNIVNINGQDGFYLKKDLYLTNSYTVIKGERVLGIPFLFIDWLKGTLVTPDGRIYADYKFKYNVYNQALSFRNGNDSLEVNEPIKEFTLVIEQPDTVITSRFINSGEYHKGKNFYYEVLLDNEKGQLLKTNQKVVTATADGIIASKTQKYLELQFAYFYFDKKLKKMRAIRPSGNITSLFNLTDDEARNLQVSSFDLSKEEDLIRLLKLYSQKPALKAF